MKEIIENTVYEVPDQAVIDAAKIEFDVLKELTLSRLYNIASKDINIFDRFACNSVKRQFQ